MPMTMAKRRSAVPTVQQPDRIMTAIDHLKLARNALRECGATKAADYAARALKSADGALRHARGRRWDESYRSNYEPR